LRETEDDCLDDELDGFSMDVSYLVCKIHSFSEDYEERLRLKKEYWEWYIEQVKLISQMEL
jgi:hypothetical protein